MFLVGQSSSAQQLSLIVSQEDSHLMSLAGCSSPLSLKKPACVRHSRTVTVTRFAVTSVMKIWSTTGLCFCQKSGITAGGPTSGPLADTMLVFLGSGCSSDVACPLCSWCADGCRAGATAAGVSTARLAGWLSRSAQFPPTAIALLGVSFPFSRGGSGTAASGAGLAFVVGVCVGAGGEDK